MRKTINNIESVDDMIVIKGLREDLRASEKSFKQLFNSSHVAQWIYDRDSLLILYINDAAIRQYGYSSKEFLNMTILEIAPSEESQKLILYNEFMKTTSESFCIVSPHRKKNSERVLVETTYVNIKYKEKSCVLVTSSNITEKIKLEEKISSLKVTRQQKITQATINGQEMEREEIGRELHDNINQQLAAAKLYLESARGNAPLRIDFIDRAAKMLANVINEIRSLSNSLALPILKDIGFKDSLNELFETYMVTQPFRIKLSFEEEVNGLDHEIQLSLFRIIQEQLNNILKHAYAKNVVISLSLSDQIKLSIKDDGKGFDTTMKRQGVGITNMRNRVVLYNGTISINSTPGEGCEILINIPNENKNENKRYANILIVEDDPDDQEIIARAFAEVAPHFKITCLSDGKMLVDLLHSSLDSELPSLIVLDYNMPMQNGLEILKVLELDQRFNKIPKIIYSNSSQNYYRNLSYSANAKAYITKGTTMDEIKENIQEMLSFV